MRLATLIAVLGLILACVDQVEEKQFLHPDEIINPNGDSELSLVMRNLHFEANKVRMQIENGEVANLDTLRQLTERLVTAVPTDSAVLDADYYMLSDLILNQLEKIPGGEDQVIEFNGLVNACVTCHKNTCPGPIEKINKLLIAG